MIPRNKYNPIPYYLFTKETESTGFSFADALKGGQKKPDNVEPKVEPKAEPKVETDRNIVAGKNV